MTRFDLSYLFHWFPRVTYKAEMLESSYWPVCHPTHRYGPTKLFPWGRFWRSRCGPNHMHQTTALCTHITVRTTFGGPRGASRSRVRWRPARTAAAAMQAGGLLHRSHGRTIWTTADSETWRYLQKTSVRARSLKKETQLVNRTWVLHLPDFSISKWK